MRYRVDFAPKAIEDLLRLFDYLIGRAQTVEDLDKAEEVIASLRQAIESQLAVTPYSFRKGGDGQRSTHRELIVPSGSTGYIARYEIIGSREVLVLAVRHQLEQDYH